MLFTKSEVVPGLHPLLQLEGKKKNNYNNDDDDDYDDNDDDNGDYDDCDNYSPQEFMVVGELALHP